MAYTQQKVCGDECYWLWAKCPKCEHKNAFISATFTDTKVIFKHDTVDNFFELVRGAENKWCERVISHKHGDARIAAEEWWDRYRRHRIKHFGDCGESPLTKLSSTLLNCCDWHNR